MLLLFAFRPTRELAPKLPPTPATTPRGEGVVSAQPCVCASSSRACRDDLYAQVVGAVDATFVWFVPESGLNGTVALCVIP